MKRETLEACFRRLVFGKEQIVWGDRNERRTPLVLGVTRLLIKFGREENVLRTGHRVELHLFLEANGILVVVPKCRL